MKKRTSKLLSLLLTLTMVLGLLPATAPHVHADWRDDWEWGDEWNTAKCSCEFCGYEYEVADVEDAAAAESALEEYFCDECGSCSYEGNDECFRQHHCEICGECADDADMCDGCKDNDVYAHWDCIAEIDDSGVHCPFCKEHYGAGVAECNCEYSIIAPHCEDCCEVQCVNCGICLVLYGEETECITNGGCLEHELCVACIQDDEDHCKECWSCDTEVCSDCGLCAECTEGWTHCPECGSCFGDEEYDRCEDGGEHCVLCCAENDWICPGCNQCMEALGMDKCEECGMCTDCCLDASEEEGCTHGYCIWSSEYEEHLCPECGVCPDDNQCDDCGLCEECQEDYHCEHGYCPDSSEWEDHLCADCGECCDPDDLCDWCGMCPDCQTDYHCEHGYCPDDPMAEDDGDHFICAQCGNCFVDYSYCEGCGLCSECVEGWCDDCGMCVTCGIEDMKHCPGCGVCCEQADDYCGNCRYCSDCMDICPNCGDMCTDCGTLCSECLTCENCAVICPDCESLCSECSLVCDGCGRCPDCAVICPDCEAYCSECSVVCNDCGTCEACAAICEECGLCENCVDICSGCGLRCVDCAVVCPDCGSACSECGVLCPDCGTCEDCTDLCLDCDRCGDCATLCQNCREYCSDCAILCEGCDTCENCADVCLDCYQVCSDCGTICPECGLCEDCCEANSIAAGCNHGVCVMSSGWAAHWSAEHEGQPHIHVYGWHSDDNGHWQVCKVGSCGDTTEKQQHTYGDWVINQPTCTSIGTKKRTCSLCSHKETIILPITHIYYEWKYDETDHWKQCVVGCGVVIAESKENHSYGDDNICDVCGYDKTVSYNVVEGNNGSWEIDATDELTFKADGDISLFIGVKIDGSFIDSSFYAVLSGSTIIKLKPEYLATLSVGIHKITVVYTNGEASAYFVITENVGSSHTHMLTPVVAKPATCTEDGNTAYYICTCGKLFKDSAAQTEITDFDSVMITAIGHDYKWIIDKAATADVSGEKHEECTKCHHKKATVLIPATGDDHIHNYIEQSVPPTCSDKGYTEHICSCGDTYKDTFVNALDHTDEDEDGKCDVCEYNVGTTTTKPEDTNKPSDDVQSPQTGDNSMMWLWVALLFVSGFGVVATAVIGKKKSSVK